MKLVISLLTIFILIGCKTTLVQNNREYVLLNNFLSHTNKGMVSLSLNNDNTYLISVISSLQKVELENNIKNSDSVQISYGIKYGELRKQLRTNRNKLKDRDSLFDLVFNKDEYNHLLKQKKKNSVWEKIKVKEKFLLPSSYPEIRVSLPIFTKNGKYAILDYSFQHHTAFVIWEKIDQKWQEITLFNKKLIAPKLKFHSTK